MPLILFGGAEGCERVMAGFGAEGTEGFPIACLHLLPTGLRFAEAPGHRDVLGALMSLGFERSLLGDIILREEEAWIFCAERIAGFIEENLLSVRKTSVRCERTDRLPEGSLYRTRRLVIQVASQRMDALVAHGFHLSRGEAQSLFPAGKVFLDGAALSPPGRGAPGRSDRFRPGTGPVPLSGGGGPEQKGQMEHGDRDL